MISIFSNAYTKSNPVYFGKRATTALELFELPLLHIRKQIANFEVAQIEMPREISQRSFDNRVEKLKLLRAEFARRTKIFTSLDLLSKEIEGLKIRLELLVQEKASHAYNLRQKALDEMLAIKKNLEQGSQQQKEIPFKQIGDYYHLEFDV